MVTIHVNQINKHKHEPHNSINYSNDIRAATLIGAVGISVRSAFASTYLKIHLHSIMESIDLQKIMRTTKRTSI